MDDHYEKIAELQEQHGNVEAFEVEEVGQLIVLAKPPTAHVEYKRIVDAIQKKEGLGQAQEDLVVACSVYPEQKTVRGLLRRFPASVGPMSKAAEDLMDGGVKRLGKVQRKPNETT